MHLCCGISSGTEVDVWLEYNEVRGSRIEKSGDIIVGPETEITSESFPPRGLCSRLAAATNVKIGSKKKLNLTISLSRLGSSGGDLEPPTWNPIELLAPSWELPSNTLSRDFLRGADEGETPTLRVISAQILVAAIIHLISSNFSSLMCYTSLSFSDRGTLSHHIGSFPVQKFTGFKRM